MNLDSFNLAADVNAPWLEMKPRSNACTVIARSHRARSETFPWKEMIDKHKDVVFVGLLTEYKDFVDRFGMVRYYACRTAREMAKFIAGAKLFIGNSSFPFALAEALKKDAIQEVADDPNFRTTVFERKGLTNIIP